MSKEVWQLAVAKTIRFAHVENEKGFYTRLAEIRV